MGFLSGVAGGFGLGKAMNDFWHPEKGYKEAAKKMQEAWRQAQGFQEPFRQAGVDQLPKLTGAQDRLLDPSGLLAEWMSKYETSPFAQRSMENAKTAGLDTASSMGLMGSSAALNNIQQSSADIMNADRQQFLNDLMQKYMTGIGIGQDIYGKGAATAGNMGNQAVGVGENLGAAAYGAKTAKSNLIKDLLAMGGKAAMASGGFGGFG
jgi:hypothetical protein